MRKKKCNLICFRIPEGGSEDAEERIKHDYDCLTKIFQAENVDPNDIENIFRVGKKNESIPRPLIVKFLDIKTKDAYLDKTSEIMHCKIPTQSRRIQALHENQKFTESASIFGKRLMTHYMQADIPKMDWRNLRGHHLLHNIPEIETY